MFDVNIATVLILSLLVMVALGVHIAIALGMTSALGIFLITGGNFDVVIAMLGSTAYESLRAYEFAVIPLFMLMGEFIGKSGAVTDVYQAIHRGLKRIPGRLAVATLLGNAIFSFVTGVSIASAAAFSRIAYPEMKKFGYNRGFALGTVAGSSCLGMLIPPSVLMIVWGLLTERSIGQIFLAGVFPGLLLVSLFVIYVLATAILRPNLVGATSPPIETKILPEDSSPDASTTQVWGSALGITFVVVAVLGGIWFGIFTPTEGAGAGAFIGLVMAIAKGMRTREIIDAILSVGRTSAPILLLLVSAALYSRTLAMTGVSTAIQDTFLGTDMLPWMIIAAMVGIWFLLGMVIDSISIMLLTVTIFEPIAVSLGYDPIAFAIIGILAIEAGLLTPPFGLLVYTVKAAIQDDDDSISVMEIFRSSTPYWIIMLTGMIAIASYPKIATYLPDLIF
ncbi:MAG: C4-dicarboxylate ABC transporter permease [Rhodospirillaceae bacterium]|nr:C4-dicarboxylate ABC transporter permease [Rhodospirillaceae bacterium]|tara:strand:- start:934 stop:2283 length:1350 start_codon:yes stop_codon:yes gene_type:complete